MIFRPLTADGKSLDLRAWLNDVQNAHQQNKLGKAPSLWMYAKARQWLVTESFKDNGDVPN